MPLTAPYIPHDNTLDANDMLSILYSLRSTTAICCCVGTPFVDTIKFVFCIYTKFSAPKLATTSQFRRTYRVRKIRN